MSRLVKRLYAIGTRGLAKGKVFEAKRNTNNKYVLNRKNSSYSGDPTNKAVNKVEVNTLNEAYELLSKDEHLINLTDNNGNRALREFKKVKVEFF